MIDILSSHRFSSTRRARSKRTVSLAVATMIALSLAACFSLLAAGCSGESQTMVKAAEAEEAGDLTTALSLYKEELENDPQNMTAIKGLAVGLYVQNLWNEALPYQEQAVRLDAKEAQIRIELGFNYMNHQNVPEKAVLVMEEAVALETTAQYLTFLGQAQKASGDLAGAEQTLREAIATDGGYAHAYTVLAAVLQAQGKVSESAEVLKNAPRVADTAVSGGDAE